VLHISNKTQGASSHTAEHNRLELVVKRILDIVGSIVLLTIFSPLLFVIVIAIKLDSPGPAIYRRRVFGFQGKTFLMYKFRSMVVNAHEILQQNAKLREEYENSLKIDADPRVTAVGRILRKTSLDEFPQLVNVLRGDMSLVGPRQLGDIELARYGDAQEMVLSVKPGLSGLWQVSGRHAVSFERRVELDLYYVNHQSLWLDLIILLKTPLAVVTGRGAV